MEAKLTPKQEKFCHAYLEKGNASEAYRSAYNTSKMKSETISRRAKEQLKHGPISARIQQLQDEVKSAHDIEKDRIMYELRSILDAKVTDYLELRQVPVNTGQVDDDGNEIVVMSSALAFKDFSKLTAGKRKNG